MTRDGEDFESVTLIGSGKLVKIKIGLEQNIKTRLVKFLKEYVDVFAWSHKDMPRLIPSH